MVKVACGLDVFIGQHGRSVKGCRLGLLSNQASLDSRLRPAKYVISQALPGQLKALFGPQHGHGGEDQDNMVETEHAVDPHLNIPVWSLYGNTREPSSEMFDSIDALIIDLQDVGTRVYTFAATMFHCMRVAAASGKKIIVLDRPNPLGGNVLEGNLLQRELFSFVGVFSLPMRHALTMAEMARVFQDGLLKDCDLECIPMQGWKRSMLWHDTGLRWVMPSPNMPLAETAQVYPGQVLWEGTNLSEGRGTCRPFEMFGAPYLDPKRVEESLSPEVLKGCILQEISFRPTFHKWAQERCRGFMLHITDPRSYRPYLLSIALLAAVIRMHGDTFAWKEPPYEYVFDKMPIDLIIGDRSLREDLEMGIDPLELEESWRPPLGEYDRWRSPFLLYR